MTIVPMASEHVDDVARLHCAHLTGLLSSLGLRAARAFYDGCIRSGLAIALVAVEDGSVRGLVLGSMRPAELRRDVVRRNRVGVLLGTLVGVARHPSALRWLLESRSAADDDAYDRESAELTYIAVDPEARGSGLGRRLVEAFARELEAAGAPSFELSVDEDNPQAILFYESLGMRRVGQYREFGTLHARYRMDPAEGVSPG